MKKLKILAIVAALLAIAAVPAFSAVTKQIYELRVKDIKGWDSQTAVNLDGSVNAVTVTGSMNQTGNQAITGDLDVSGEMRMASLVIDTITTYLSPTTDSYQLTTDDRGKYLSNATATATATYKLPTESVAGASYFFMVKASYALSIEPQPGQQILGLTDTNGDAIRNSGTAGDVIEMIYVGDNQWVQGKIRGTWTDVN